MTDDSDTLPPEYQAALDEGPPPPTSTVPCHACGTPRPRLHDHAPRRDYFAEMRAALPQARLTSEAQERVRVAMREASARMDRMEALARLDFAVELIKSIPLPEPINFIVDGIAEGIRMTIRKLMA
jgi:hypothetical protein